MQQNRKWQKLLRGMLLLVMMMGASSLQAQSARKWIEEGNSAVQQGRYGEALSAYQNADDKTQNLPQVKLNQGIAHYKQGQFDKASKLFQEAAQTSQDQTMEAHSKYNLGNSLFRESESYRSTDPQKSLELLKQSVNQYRDAYSIQENLKDAAHNLEVAKLVEQQLKQEVEQQKTNQKSSSEQKDQQKSSHEQFQDQKNQSTASQSDPSSNEPDNSDKTAQSDQESQQNASGQQHNHSGDRSNENNANENSVADAEDSKQITDQEVQNILQEETKNREQRYIFQAKRYVPVEKDW